MTGMEKKHENHKICHSNKMKNKIKFRKLFQNSLGPMDHQHNVYMSNENKKLIEYIRVKGHMDNNNNHHHDHMMVIGKKTSNHSQQQQIHQESNTHTHTHINQKLKPNGKNSK